MRDRVRTRGLRGCSHLRLVKLGWFLSASAKATAPSSPILLPHILRADKTVTTNHTQPSSPPHSTGKAALSPSHPTHPVAWSSSEPPGLPATWQDPLTCRPGPRWSWHSPGHRWWQQSPPRSATPSPGPSTQPARVLCGQRFLTVLIRTQPPQAQGTGTQSSWRLPLCTLHHVGTCRVCATQELRPFLLGRGVRQARGSVLGAPPHGAGGGCSFTKSVTVRGGGTHQAVLGPARGAGGEARAWPR